MRKNELLGTQPEISNQDIASQVRALLNPGVLTPEQAAAYIGIQPSTLAVWRSTGRYKIIFLKIGSRIRYRQSDLDAWLESRTRTNGATA